MKISDIILTLKQNNINARVKATGELVDGNAMVSFRGDDFYLKELEAIQDDSDYWTRLEHSYAGMAMQGLLQSPHLNIMQEEPLVGMASSIAQALVEKMKEERK